MRSYTSPHLALILLPLLVLFRNSNPIFNSLGYIDPWVYYGFFRNLILFKRNLFPGTYYGSRLSWILPGFAANQIFPPLIANYVLHLAVFYVAVWSLYFILARTLNRPTAYLTAIVFGLNPYLWTAVGSDYPDGAAIAYYLLAMALLTSASERQRPAWLLGLAGASIAGLVYTNIIWIVLVPLLAVYYLFRRSAASAEHWLIAALRFCLWVGAGVAVVTVVFGAINHALDGNFWFYAPSIRFVLNNAHDARVYQSAGLQWLWKAGWLLWPSLILLATLLAPIQLFRKPRTENTAALLFIGNFICFLVIFVAFDLFGSPMIEYHYYASMLLPAAFLAAGALLTRLSSDWSIARTTVAGAIAAIALSATFWDPAGRIWQFEKALGLGVMIALTAATVLWRSLRTQSNASLAALLVAFAGCAIAAPRTDQIFMWPGMWQTGTELRDGFLRINDALGDIDAAHAEADIRFWLDDQDPNHLELRSLASVYLFNYSLLGRSFPTLPADAAITAGSLVLIPSSRDDVPALAAQSLQARQLIPALIAHPVVERAGVKYTLYLFRLDRDPASLQPLALENGGQLKPTASSAALSSQNWQLAGNSGTMANTAAGIRVTTPASQWGYAASYRTPLTADVDGRYLFQLRHQIISGRITFGVLSEDRSKWLAQAPPPVRNDASLVAEVTVELKAGQRIWLQTANNQPNGNRPSTFIIQKLTAYRLR